MIATTKKAKFEEKMNQVTKNMHNEIMMAGTSPQLVPPKMECPCAALTIKGMRL